MTKAMPSATLAEMDNDSDDMPEHEINHHIDTLHKAAKIQADPNLMKKLAPHIEKHKKAAQKMSGPISSMDELKTRSKARMKELDQSED